VKRRALAALLLAGACGGEPANLGPDPDFLWWSDHETGDLADWSRGGTELGATYVQSGDVSVTTERARSGTHALRSTVTAPVGAAQIWRAGLDASAAYYGAWFLLPTAPQPAANNSYWVFFALRARTAPGTDLPLWDLKLAGAQPELQLLAHDAGDVEPLAHVPVPIGRWFHVEAFYVPAADAGGRLRIWLDGATIYDLSGPTAPAGAATAPVTWTLGTNTDGLTPAPATLFVDDAYVSRRRLGPGFPPFWRAR
jgi:hypothetical protein